MDVHHRAIFQWAFRRACRARQQHVDHLARRAKRFDRDDVPAAYDAVAVSTLIATRLDVGQLNRDARTGMRYLDVLVVRLKVADACADSRRLNDHRLTALELAAAERAGDDGADALEAEGTIERQARLADVARRRRFQQDIRQRRLQLVEPAAATRRGRDNRRFSERRIAQFLVD